MRLLLFFALWALAPASLCAQTLTRSEALEVARTYAELKWEATEKNVRHGPDAAGVPVSTPSATPGEAVPEGFWLAGQTNAGMPYKWGGFDSLTSFTNGVAEGKAAGDLYNAEKRRKADAAVSREAVGIDCSGFISRCWKLARKYGTSTLPEICVRLRSPAELKAGDIMNYEGGHVLLFAEWLDETRDRARFYEAEPYSKVRASEYSTSELAASGFVPWRYKRMRD